jgi:hypothetical protein
MNGFMSSGVGWSICDGFVCLLFIDIIWSIYQHENNLDIMSSDCQVKWRTENVVKQLPIGIYLSDCWCFLRFESDILLDW